MSERDFEELSRTPMVPDGPTVEVCVRGVSEIRVWGEENLAKQDLRPVANQELQTANLQAL